MPQVVPTLIFAQYDDLQKVEFVRYGQKRRPGVPMSVQNLIVSMHLFDHKKQLACAVAMDSIKQNGTHEKLIIFELRAPHQIHIR